MFAEGSRLAPRAVPAVRALVFGLASCCTAVAHRQPLLDAFERSAKQNVAGSRRRCSPVKRSFAR